MDRRLLFPAIAVTAWGQQTSPSAVEAEKALRARVDQFYQLEIDQKFRAAEALVAKESKDYFYNANKPKLETFTYGSAEFSDNNTKAKVTVKVKTEVFFPGVGAQVFETPLISDWKLEDGQWSWYFDKDAALNTPFGRMNPGPGGVGGASSIPQMPDAAALKSQVTISQTSVALTDNEPVKFVTLTNRMAGPIGVEISSSKMEGLTVELEKNQVKANETIGIRFRLTDKVKTAGITEVTCSPLGQQFEIQVTAN